MTLAMNEETFARLLQQREGETLDFKQELPASSDLAVLISAFYNTRGGAIVVGVDDQRQPVGVGARSTFHVSGSEAVSNVKPGT